MGILMKHDNIFYDALVCWEVQPDELSGFNAPINVYSNMENGSGILGAFWRTASEKIIIDKEFIISQCN